MPGLMVYRGRRIPLPAVFLRSVTGLRFAPTTVPGLKCCEPLPEHLDPSLIEPAVLHQDLRPGGSHSPHLCCHQARTDDDRDFVEHAT
jgi:hypothetical protein